MKSCYKHKQQEQQQHQTMQSIERVSMDWDGWQMSQYWRADIPLTHTHSSLSLSLAISVHRNDERWTRDPCRFTFCISLFIRTHFSIILTQQRDASGGGRPLGLQFINHSFIQYYIWNRTNSKVHFYKFHAFIFIFIPIDICIGAIVNFPSLLIISYSHYS